jgi:hypothetical protein
VQSAPSDIVGVQGAGAPAVISTNCNALTGWTPLWLSCYTSMAPGVFYEQGAFLLAVKPNQDGGLRTNLKGRLNFPTLGSGPGHIITLSDSNFQKTIATANNRPSNDANDAFIGYDQGDGNPAHVGISMGAPVSLSDYIGNVGDGTNWLERLTSGLKEFKTSVQLDNTLTVAGTAQASSLLTTGVGSWAVQGSYGTLSPALTGKSAIGFGTSGKLQVSENGGVVVEVAKLDSGGNVSENANTATQLAQTPTQCNGSFATGVQANGNANCSVADVIQLAETGPPIGIPNYGIFWFDATCHCPKVISNNGQPVQLGLLNVFNADANTLEEYNGASPQFLNVYGTRTDASNYERMRLGYDTTDGYFLLGADALGTGLQRGLGFWLQGSLRWVIDSGFNLKPWSDNVKDIGAPTLRLKHLYLGTYADLTGGALATDIANEGTTGTTLNKLAKVTGSPATAIIASTSDTNGVIGVVVDGAGTTGSAQIARGGQASCAFDGSTSAGDYVQISSTAAGDCHDAGASYPGIGQVLGRVLSTNASAGTYAMLAAGSEVQAPSAEAVTTVFGRAGTITAQAGDYSAGQITGAAALASPAFTGAPTAPTPASGDNSTKIATTAWVGAQGYAIATSETRGYPVTGSGSSLAASALFLDATQFSGSANAGGTCGAVAPLSNDPGGQIQAAICNLPSGIGGVIDARGFASGSTWGSNPFASPTDATGATLTAKNVTLLLPAGSFTINATWFLPTQSHTVGQGSLTTTLVWGGPAPGAGNCDSSGSSKCVPMICMGSPILVTGTLSCESPGVFTNTPRIQIEGLKLDNNQAANSVALADITAQEKSWFQNGQIINFTKAGIWIGRTGSQTITTGVNQVQNAGPFTNLEILYGCTANTYGIYVNNGPSVVIGKGGHITVNANTVCNTPPGAAIAVELNGLQATASNIHCERWATCVEAGGIANALDVDIQDITATATLTNAVHISGANHTTGVVQSIESQGTNSILDDQSGFVSSSQSLASYVVGQASDANNFVAFGASTFGGNVDFQSSAEIIEIPNAGTTGTTVNHLAKLTGAPSTAVIAATTDTSGILGIVAGGAGTGGNAQIAIDGQAQCVFDGATTAGDYVAISSTTAGDCHDAGATRPASNQILGRVLTTHGSGGTYNIMVNGPDDTGAGSGSGTVASVTFTGDGTVLSSTPSSAVTSSGTLTAALATAGSYSVLGNNTNAGSNPAYVKVTSNMVDSSIAPLASPSFTGTPAAPTPSTADNSTKIATTAYVQAQGYLTAVPTCPLWFTQPHASSTVSFSGTANKASVWGVALYCTLATTQITYDVATADNTANTYDLGIVNSSGTIVAHIGSTAGTSFAASTGWKTLSWAAAATLPPGKYYLAITSSCISSCAVLEGGSSGVGFTFAGNQAVSVTAGGTLPATITPPSDAYTASTIPVWSVH